MICLLMALLSVTVSGVKLDHYWINVVGDGDSNTYSGFIVDSNWVNLTADTFETNTTYAFHNIGYSGKTVLEMITDAPADVDVFDNTYFGVSLLSYGSNDHVVADSLYALVIEYCTDRQAAGWYTIVVTSTEQDAGVVIATDSVVANYLTFADDIIQVHLDPNIGNTSDNTNPVYWRDTGHITEFGQSIKADSVIKHLVPLMNTWRRL